MKNTVEFNLTILAFIATMIISLPAHAGQSNDDIAIENAHVPQLPVTSMTRAAYLTITNNSDEIRTITGVKADGFKMAHLHQTEKVDGVISMKALAALEIGPGETLALEPGGLHIMLMHPAESYASSSEVSITLSFANGHTVDLVALVQAAN